MLSNDDRIVRSQLLSKLDVSHEHYQNVSCRMMNLVVINFTIFSVFINLNFFGVYPNCLKNSEMMKHTGISFQKPLTYFIPSFKPSLSKSVQCFSFLRKENCVVFNFPLLSEIKASGKTNYWNVRKLSSLSLLLLLI